MEYINIHAKSWIIGIFHGKANEMERWIMFYITLKKLDDPFSSSFSFRVTVVSKVLNRQKKGLYGGKSIAFEFWSDYAVSFAHYVVSSEHSAACTAPFYCEFCGGNL